MGATNTNRTKSKNRFVAQARYFCWQMRRSKEPHGLVCNTTKVQTHAQSDRYLRYYEYMYFFHPISNILSSSAIFHSKYRPFLLFYFLLFYFFILIYFTIFILFIYCYAFGWLLITHRNLRTYWCIQTFEIVILARFCPRPVRPTWIHGTNQQEHVNGVNQQASDAVTLDYLVPGYYFLNVVDEMNRPDWWRL